MRVALIQTTSSDIAADSCTHVMPMIEQAAAAGADLAITPEVTNVISASRSHQQDVLQTEEADLTLATLRDAARRLSIHILIGSLALRGTEGRFVNRSLLIGRGGHISARYDKIHMFDVTLPDGTQYRESHSYAPGKQAVIAPCDTLKIGMTICYDVRFPHLYRMLGQAGAHIITVPSAFTVPTGQVHWETLLRARAIETGAYVLAPAQTGMHPSTTEKPRESFGHSLAISPWGQILVDAGTAPGVHYVEIDPDAVTKARSHIPAIDHTPDFEGPI